MVPNPIIIRRVLLTGAGRHPPGPAPVGPPTFTSHGFSFLSGSDPNYTSTITIGDSFAGRFVTCILFSAGGAILSADIDGITASVIDMGVDAVNGTKWFCVTAVVPTGDGTATLSVVSDGGIFGNGIVTWTADSADLVSQTPTDQSATVTASSTFSTGTIDVAEGGAVLAYYLGYGQSGADCAITTPNSIGVVQDGSNYGFSGVSGTKNGATAATAGTVSAGATGTGNPIIGLVSFR